MAAPALEQPRRSLERRAPPKNAAAAPIRFLFVCSHLPPAAASPSAPPCISLRRHPPALLCFCQRGARARRNRCVAGAHRARVFLRPARRRLRPSSCHGLRRVQGCGRGGALCVAAGASACPGASARALARRLACRARPSARRVAGCLRVLSSSSPVSPPSRPQATRERELEAAAAAEAARAQTAAAARARQAAETAAAGAWCRALSAAAAAAAGLTAATRATPLFTPPLLPFVCSCGGDGGSASCGVGDVRRVAGDAGVGGGGGGRRRRRGRRHHHGRARKARRGGHARRQQVVCGCASGAP